MDSADASMNPPLEDESRKLCQACAEVRELLGGVAEKIRVLLQDRAIMAETPLEAGAVMELAVESIGAAIQALESSGPVPKPALAPPRGGPTRQQGQFLAFIRQYMLLNVSGVAPSHADFQRFFNLTPPSVNSMLIRLEQRGFIRRISGKARAIELIIEPGSFPPLERPFKY